MIELSMQPDFDVLIIGGGMVGASLALALRHSGLPGVKDFRVRVAWYASRPLGRIHAC